MLDESSLASSRQMRQFLEKLGPQDRVLLIGDTRQHQAVEAGGESVTYDPRRLRGVSAYRETPREFATGDRIQFTQSDREHRIRSGDVATVERIAADNGLTVKLDNGKSFELNRDRAKHIDYGYTGDGLQRLAADRVIGTAEKLEPATLANVSPHTRDLTVYTSESAAIQPKEPAIAKVPNCARLLESSQGLTL